MGSLESLDVGKGTPGSTENEASWVGRTRKRSFFLPMGNHQDATHGGVSHLKRGTHTSPRLWIDNEGHPILEGIQITFGATPH